MKMKKSMAIILMFIALMFIALMGTASAELYPRFGNIIDIEYDTDFIDCILWTGIAENTAEYCKKGDLLE